MGIITKYIVSIKNAVAVLFWCVVVTTFIQIKCKHIFDEELENIYEAS